MRKRATCTLPRAAARESERSLSLSGDRPSLLQCRIPVDAAVSIDHDAVHLSCAGGRNPAFDDILANPFGLTFMRRSITAARLCQGDHDFTVLEANLGAFLEVVLSSGRITLDLARPRRRATAAALIPWRGADSMPIGAPSCKFLVCQQFVKRPKWCCFRESKPLITPMFSGAWV